VTSQLVDDVNKENKKQGGNKKSNGKSGDNIEPTQLR
jgi:hypothetical protein